MALTSSTFPDFTILNISLIYLSVNGYFGTIWKRWASAGVI